MNGGEIKNKPAKTYSMGVKLKNETIFVGNSKPIFTPSFFLPERLC
jgi:hypothetical protein